MLTSSWNRPRPRSRRVSSNRRAGWPTPNFIAGERERSVASFIAIQPPLGRTLHGELHPEPVEGRTMKRRTTARARPSWFDRLTMKATRLLRRLRDVERVPVGLQHAGLEDVAVEVLLVVLALVRRRPRAPAVLDQPAGRI